MRSARWCRSGIIVSEPAKAALVSERVPLVAGLSALAIENLFYSLSVALFIFSGTAALLLSFQLDRSRCGSSASARSSAVVVHHPRRLFCHSQAVEISERRARISVRARRRAQRFLRHRRERVRSLEDRVYGFYTRNRSRFLPIMLLEACFHLSGVAEVYVMLYFISDMPADAA